MASAADVVVRRLRDAGTRAMFGVPGGGSLDLIDAAGRAGLPFVLTATETAAAIAAIAQAEISGAPGACLTALGPGAASVVNGAACATLERAPLLVFTDAAPRAADGHAHQRLDHRALLAPVTKWSGTLDPDNPSATLDCALAAATAPPPGAVHVEVG
jgi:acetolactate synthase-1/2/3 large subunit